MLGVSAQNIWRISGVLFTWHASWPVKQNVWLQIYSVFKRDGKHCSKNSIFLFKEKPESWDIYTY